MELPPRVRTVGRLLVLLAVLGFTLWLVHRLVSKAGWTAVWSELQAADPSLLALAVVLKLGVMGVWTWRWRLAVHRFDRSPPARVLFMAQVAGIFANHVAPFARLAGGVVRTRYLRGLSGLSTSRALAAVLFDQAVHLLSMGGLTVLALAVAAALLGRPGLAVAVALGALAAGALLLVLRRRRETPLTESLADYLAARAEGRNDGPGRLLRGAGTAAEAISELAAAKGLWLEAAALGGLLFTLNALTQWTAFLALGHRVDPWAVAAAVALGATAGTLTATPGGLGGTEAAMIAFYSALGADPAVSAAGTLLFRAVHFAVVIGTGLPSFALLELRLARR